MNIFGLAHPGNDCGIPIPVLNISIRRLSSVKGPAFVCLAYYRTETETHPYNAVSSSILNTIADIITSEYPAIFIIRPPEMAEAEREGKILFASTICVELQEVPVATKAHPSHGFWNRLGQRLDRQFLSRGD